MTTITISREYGSGGDEIASRVSQKLGYRYFDKSLMAQIVSESGLSEHDIIDFSEDSYSARSFLDRLLAWRGTRDLSKVSTWEEDPTGTLSKQAAALNEAQGIALVQSAVRAAYRQGNVVIVGRGGQAILKGLPGVLHVRIQAPLETRFRRLATSGHIRLLGLQKQIAEHDQATADYLKRFYDINWADPLLYDLVINTEHLDVDTATQLIVDAARLIPAPEPAREAV